MDINFWSVLIAGIVAFIIGAIWYSPILFGKEWMELRGCKDTTEIKKSGVIGLYIIQLILTIISFCVLGFAMAAGAVSGASDGAIAGILAWLGFQLPIHLGSLMWDRRPGKLVMINLVHALLVMVVGGAIIGAW